MNNTDAINELITIPNILPRKLEAVEMAIEALKEQEKLVRCKDCEYCSYDESVPCYFCTNWSGGTDADGFCHEGER